MARNPNKKTRPAAEAHEEKTGPSPPAAKTPESFKQSPEEKLPPVPEPGEWDEVDEASLDSFPASDPPGYGTGHV